MLIRSAVVAAALLAGCAPTAPPSAPVATHDLPTAPLAVTYDLPPVAAPELPSALRTGPTPATAAPMDHAAMDHDGMDPAATASDATPVPPAPTDHAAMGHAMPEPSPAAPMDHPDHAAANPAAMTSMAPATDLRPEALAPAVDAYLALQAALATDRFSAGDAAAQTLSAALVQAGVGAELQAHAVAADAATDLVALRDAFGRLSPPFIALVERIGAPAGVELSAFRCGMADAPQGGVWLQATDDLANPYFGAAMRTCGRQTGTLDAAAPHGAMRHETGVQHD